MAKLDSTGTLSQTRGRTGAIVVSSNASGSYARAWFMPRNPRTPAQLAWQRNWQEWTALWTALSSATRGTWETASAAAVWTRTDWFGQPYQPSGFNLWLMICAIRSALGLTISSSPPSGSVPTGTLTCSLGLTNIDPVNGGRWCELYLSQSNTSAWAYVEFQTAWMVSANGSARNKPYRPLLATTFGTKTYQNATSEANELVGWIPPDTRCWYRYRGWSSGLLPSLWQEGYASPGA